MLPRRSSGCMTADSRLAADTPIHHVARIFLWRHRPKAKGWKNICWDFWSFKGHGITKGVFWGQYPEILPRIRDQPQRADCGSWRLGQTCLQSGVSVIRVAADIEVFKYCLILTLINVPLRGPLEVDPCNVRRLLGLDLVNGGPSVLHQLYNKSQAYMGLYVTGGGGHMHWVFMGREMDH